MDRTCPATSWNAVLERLKKADVLVIGSPVYWHNICGSVRNVLDRFLWEGFPRKLIREKTLLHLPGSGTGTWMLEAGEFTMKRFAALYGLTYMGMAKNAKEAGNLAASL